MEPTLEEMEDAIDMAHEAALIWDEVHDEYCPCGAHGPWQDED